MKRTAAHCEPDSATVKATRDSFRELCMSDDLVPQEPSKTRVSVSRWLTRRRRSSCSAVVPVHSRIFAPLAMKLRLRTRSTSGGRHTSRGKQTLDKRSEVSANFGAAPASVSSEVGTRMQGQLAGNTWRRRPGGQRINRAGLCTRWSAPTPLQTTYRFRFSFQR